MNIEQEEKIKISPGIAHFACLQKEQGKGRKSSVWGTLRTQCKPQKPSLILPGLGNFLSCCHILTLLIWSQTKGWDMTSGDCCDHRGQLFPKSSTRNGLTQERDEGFSLLLPHLPVQEFFMEGESVQGFGNPIPALLLLFWCSLSETP